MPPFAHQERFDFPYSNVTDVDIDVLVKDYLLYRAAPHIRTMLTDTTKEMIRLMTMEEGDLRVQFDPKCLKHKARDESTYFSFQHQGTQFAAAELSLGSSFVCSDFNVQDPSTQVAPNPKLVSYEYKYVCLISLSQGERDVDTRPIFNGAWTHDIIIDRLALAMQPLQEAGWQIGIVDDGYTRKKIRPLMQLRRIGLIASENFEKLDKALSWDSAHPLNTRNKRVRRQYQKAKGLLKPGDEG